MVDTQLPRISDLIGDLGSSGQLAGTLGCSPSAVRMWVTKDCIPPKYHWTVHKLAEARGITVSMDDMPRLRERYDDE